MDAKFVQDVIAKKIAFEEVPLLSFLSKAYKKIVTVYYEQKNAKATKFYKEEYKLFRKKYQI